MNITSGRDGTAGIAEEWTVVLSASLGVVAVHLKQLHLCSSWKMMCVCVRGAGIVNLCCATVLIQIPPLPPAAVSKHKTSPGRTVL